MKRIITASILLVLLILPFSNGLALPADKPAADPNFNFAPGSIVRFEHLSSKDGLSQNAGLDIFQDSRGYLWFGTQDGLNRYDGYSFKVYKHDPDDPKSLSPHWRSRPVGSRRPRGSELVRTGVWQATCVLVARARRVHLDR